MVSYNKINSRLFEGRQIINFHFNILFSEQIIDE